MADLAVCHPMIYQRSLWLCPISSSSSLHVYLLNSAFWVLQGLLVFLRVFECSWDGFEDR